MPAAAVSVISDLEIPIYNHECHLHMYVPGLTDGGKLRFSEQWEYLDVFDMLKQLDVLPHTAGTSVTSQTSLPEQVRLYSFYYS